MLNFLGTLFSGKAIGAIGDITKEIIDTPLEKAQAQVVKLKAIDPNGNMRLAVNKFTCQMYGFYLVTTVIMILMSVWGVGGDLCSGPADAQECVSRADVAAGRMTELFTPITASWATIVTGSFGVNTMNSYKGK